MGNLNNKEETKKKHKKNYSVIDFGPKDSKDKNFLKKINQEDNNNLKQKKKMSVDNTDKNNKSLKPKINKEVSNPEPIKDVSDKTKINPKPPNDCILFENINIFNSILIMLINIPIINEYFKNDKTKSLIDACDKNNKNCITSVLFYLHSYLWNTKEKNNISEKDLYYKYLEVLNKCSNNNTEYFCYDIQNLRTILNFILSEINNEITKEKKNKDTKLENNNDLNKYLIDDFSKNNCSIIADHFMGFYQYHIICNNCRSRTQRLNLNNNNTVNPAEFTEYKLEYYSYFYFNINEINKNINNNRIYESNTNSNTPMGNNIFQVHNNYIDIINCFDYITSNINQSYQIYCNNCKIPTMKYEYKLLFTLPKILTIVLNISDNYNFFLLDELNLKDYSLNPFGYEKYNLISILCQFIDTKKYICYCINPYDGLWYSYTDKKIEKTKIMDNNAIPMIVIYQSQNNINFKYNNLERNSFEKCCLNFKFVNGFNPIKKIFTKDEVMENVIKEIASYVNFQKEKIKLLFEGKSVNPKLKLSEVIKESEDIAEVLVLMSP